MDTFVSWVLSIGVAVFCLFVAAVWTYFDVRRREKEEADKEHHKDAQ